MAFKMELDRAERRRVAKHRAKQAQYAASKFNDSVVRYAGVHPRPSKYMPHIGAKQRAKGARLSA